MRRLGVVAAALMLAGCIPQVEQDYRAAHPPQPPPTRPAPAQPPIEPPPSAEPPQDNPAPVETRARRTRPMPVTPSRPVWEARPVTADAVLVAGSQYRVRPGDTLAGIALRTGTSPGAIAHANALAGTAPLVAGRSLTIPGGRYHVVRSGQSGIAIARAYGVTWSRIIAANALAEPFVLRAGERILIPAPPAGISRVAERAAAFRLDIDDILTGGEPAPSPREAPARAAAAARGLAPTAVVIAPARLTGGFIWPVSGRIAKRFGPGASGERNDGIEIATATGTPIRAAASGVVDYVCDGTAQLGGLVIVKHGDGWTSVYGHASQLLVQRGQAVRQGETLALAGDSGGADRPEVHFELRKGRTPVDPTSQLPPR